MLTTTKSEQRKAKLEAEQAKLKVQQAELKAEWDAEYERIAVRARPVARRLFAIEVELRILPIMELVGIANAVKLNSNQTGSMRHLTNCPGTLLKFSRDKVDATVDFLIGEKTERWKVCSVNLIPVGEAIKQVEWL